uniref:ciliary microtubule inner protein 4 isoform X2 n=1 Tax=Pristiophorus japonicus TaxID=55135 RepID=UPI00398E6566
MDPECPQFQAHLQDTEDSLTKKGLRFPGRSLFGTTLDSKGFYQGLSEDQPLFKSSDAQAQPCQQPAPQLPPSRCNLSREPVGTPKVAPWSCLESERVLRLKQENGKKASATRLDTKSVSPCDGKPDPRYHHEALALSPDGKSREGQIDNEIFPAQGEMSGMQSSVCETPERVPSREEEFVIPQNIRHKFGSQVVDEVLTNDEVKKFLNQKELSSKSSDAECSKVQPQESVTDNRDWYEKIGFPLRCNVFPGFSGGWKSESQDTYTKEVVHRSKFDPEHWHGRTTDELGRWVEMNIVHRKMKKALKQLEKRLENA